MDRAGVADVAWVDAYCERTGPGLAAEPLNAVTNLAFLIAALALWRLVRGDRGQQAAPASLATLAVLLAVIGLCSLAFHTLATGWAGALDSLSIAAFVHFSVICFAR